MWFDIQTNLTDILRKKICRKKIVTILIMTIALFFPLEFRTKIKMTDFITLIHHCTRSSKQVQKRPWRKRKRDWMGVFIVFRGQSWVRVPTHWQSLCGLDLPSVYLRRENLGFVFKATCPGVVQKPERRDEAEQPWKHQHMPSNSLLHHTSSPPYLGCCQFIGLRSQRRYVSTRGHDKSCSELQVEAAPFSLMA